MRDRSLRSAIAAAVFASAAFAPLVANAGPCSDGTDALNLARRARKTFYDFAAIEREYTLDKELAYASIAAGEAYFAPPAPPSPPAGAAAPGALDSPAPQKTPAPLHTFVNGAAFFGIDGIPGYQLCTPAGTQKEPVGFVREGFIVGVDDIPSKLSAELAVVFSSASASHVLPRSGVDIATNQSSPSGTSSVTDFSIAQTLFAASARYSEWVQGTVGWLTREHTEIASNVVASPSSQDPGNHLIGAIGVPGLNLTQTLIVGTTSRPIETYALDFDRFPIAHTHYDVTAALAYLDEERQTYSVVGAGYGTKDHGGPRIGVDGAVEYNDPRFRYARVRGDLGFGKVLPWFYVGAGIDLSLSIFNSRYLYEQTSKQMVPGIEFGAHTQFSSGPFAFGCQLSVSTNRPELMSVFVQSVDSVAGTASAFVRISPPI